MVTFPIALKTKSKLDFFLGVLVASPIKYPDEPYYWFALLAMLIAFPRIMFVRDNIVYLYAVILLSALSVLANLYSPFSIQVNYVSALASALIFYLFLFRYCIRDVHGFLSGFLLVAKIYAVSVIVMFFILKPYSSFGNFFVSSEARMWADGYLPEWPNVFCVFLVLSFFIFISRRMHVWATISILSALLTTSRMAILGLGLFLLFLFLRSSWRSKGVSLIGFVFCIIVLYYLSDNQLFLDYLAQRFFKTGDRRIIFDSLYDAFVAYPFGVGNLPFETINDAYVSYHSSFLKIAVRYGIFSFLIFVFLVFPRNIKSGFLSYSNLPLFFLISVGVVQDMLLHLHFILLYSVFLKCREDKLYD